jgi:AraC-like DNA-binding protein
MTKGRNNKRRSRSAKEWSANNWEATFRVGPLVNLAPLVRSLGCNPEPLFKQAGFCLEDFQDPDHRMPYIRSSQLLASCVEATGCEHLGLLLGQQAEPSHLGIAGFLVRAAPNVEQALKALAENLDLHDESGAVTLDVGPDFSTLSFSVILNGVSAIDQIYDISAVMMCKIMQALCGPEWCASTIRLARREPEDPAPFRKFFGKVLFFDSTECAITFGNSCLKRQAPTADAMLYKHLCQEANELHALQHHELIEELPGALRRGLLTEQFAAHHIAGVFGLHERTLHRRLRAAGTSFRQELDQARMSVSEQLLGSTSLPVCDIANALGYADSSGFIRAFQRWCGTTPSSWRKQNSPLLREKNFRG